MSAYTLAYAGGIAKRNYSGRSVAQVVGQASPFLDELMKSPIPYTGGGEPAASESAEWNPKYVWSVDLAPNRIVKTTNSHLTSLPSGGQDLIKQASQGMVTTLGGIAVTDAQLKMLNQGKGGEIAFGNLVETLKKSNVSALKHDMERQLFSTNLGTVVGTDGSTYIDLDNDAYIRRGDVIDTYLSTTKVGDSYTVSNVDFDVLGVRGRCRVYITGGTGTPAVDHVVYREDVYGVEGTTLPQILSKQTEPGGGGTNAYAGYNESDYMTWGALVRDAAGAPFESKEHISWPIHDIYVRTGVVIDRVIMHSDLAESYASKYTTEIRRLIDGKPQTLGPLAKFDLGWMGNGLVFTHPTTGREVKITGLYTCPRNMILGYSSADVGALMHKNILFYEGTNDIWRMQLSSGVYQTAWEATPIVRWGLWAYHRCGYKYKNVAA